MALKESESKSGYPYSLQDAVSSWDQIVANILTCQSIGHESAKSIVDDKVSNPERFLLKVYGMGSLFFKGIPASVLNDMAVKTQFSPIGETEIGSGFVYYLRGRADALKEAVNLTPTELINLSK